jgi:hypothetical protein
MPSAETEALEELEALTRLLRATQREFVEQLNADVARWHADGVAGLGDLAPVVIAPGHDVRTVDRAIKERVREINEFPIHVSRT